MVAGCPDFIEDPIALRHRLSTGLPFSLVFIVVLVTGNPRVYPSLRFLAKDVTLYMNAIHLH